MHMRFRIVLHCVALAVASAIVGVGDAQPPLEGSPAEEVARESLATADGDRDGAAGETSWAPDDTEAVPEGLLKPKCQLHVPSISRLTSAARESRVGRMALHIASVLAESRTEPADGLKNDVFMRALEFVATWPDAAADVSLFSPDVDGRLRWGVRLSLPVGQAHDLLVDLMANEDLAEFFDGLESSLQGQSFVYTVADKPVATLKADATDRCLLVSHAELTVPDEIFTGTEGDGELALAARLAISKTEKDSGATFLSKFDVVNSINYTAHIAEGGGWQEQLRVNWPPVAGMTMKAFLGKAKQTFFVPEDTFLAAVFNVALVKTMLDRAVGLSDEADEALGPIQEHARDELFVAVMPGVGFLPAPDIVLQSRVSEPEELISRIGQRVKQLNRKAKKDDRRPEWHEISVRGKRVFWNQGSQQLTGLVPVTFRPVLFVQESADAQDRKRTYLVMGWTSTDPERFVRRWLDLKRPDEPRFIPTARGLNGQAWVHWQQLYDWTHPYVNLGLTSAASDGVLPEELGRDISAADITVRLKYEGLEVTQSGPVPMGIVAVPAMMAASLKETTGSDLARERMARRKLMVLYHHSQLFHRDTGRWPTSVAELDGYIDFAGHPELLRLETSSKKKFAKMFTRWFGDQDRKEEEDGVTEDNGDSSEVEDEVEGLDPDESVFEVDWIDDEWTLGIKTGTLEHLQQLYVDREGNIHRFDATSVTTEDERPKIGEKQSDDGQSGDEQSGDGDRATGSARTSPSDDSADK